MNYFLLHMLVCLALIAASAPANATEYFVSTRGSDAADGASPAAAFATIQHGVDVLEPGDTLTIQPGEYFEHVRREGLGNSEATTLIRAAIPGTVLLRGDVPAPQFRPVDGRRFVHVAEFEAAEGVHAVHELDTLVILEPMPNVTELEFAPGKFYYDQEAGKLYISTSDWQPPSAHRYTVAVTPTHGLYLDEPQRVVIEGIAVTGFTAAHEQPQQDRTLNSTWGIFIARGKDCVVRDCHAYLNGQGIGINSQVLYDGGYGGNVIERCVAWANASGFGVGDRGGLTLIYPSRDVIRDSQAYLNGDYGINIRGGGTTPRGEEHKSRLINNLAWGNGRADVKIKTGHDSVHTTEHTVATHPSNDYDPVHCLFWETDDKLSVDNIVLDQEKNLSVDQEFADPENHDYRLQATSRFRGAMPDGGDRGPFPYQPTIHYVSPDGDDNADGLSVGQAWRTLARATRDLEAGDTLYLLPGTHDADTTLALTGTAAEPIAIRGRGAGLVKLEGALHVADSSHVTFERLRFAQDLSVANSDTIAFTNCRFTGADRALNATNATRLDVRHCEFSEFGRAAISLTNSSNVHLSGNLYDNHDTAALELDAVEAVRYADYNIYRQADTAWQVNGEVRSLGDLQNHETQASQAAQGAVDDRQTTADRAASVAARGPLGRPVGNYRHRHREHELRLAAPPTVRSLSATTANLEWVTSQPAACEVAWGETPACRNTDTFVANHFASYSLVGLEPGTTYYFRVNALKDAPSLLQAIGYGQTEDGSRLALDGETLLFTTPAQDPSPRTYYVSTDGDDAASGLDRANAWRTITHAAAQVGVGDTVRIAGGVYPERVRVRATGAADTPITFAAIPGEKVVLAGADKQLNQGFVAAKKSHLRFDGFYFRDFSRDPLQGWHHRISGEFHLYQGQDIRITRCFSDGRNGYTARFVSALQVEDLVVRNCVIINKMSGSLMLNACPGFRLEHSVIARPMIQSIILYNDADQSAVLTHNIFTDMLKKKADMNIPLFYFGHTSVVRQVQNGYFLRSFPPQERALVGRGHDSEILEELGSSIVDPLFANPRFAGDPSEGTTEDIDAMVHPSLDLDFNDFFATNPEMNKRDIGLQRAAFENHASPEASDDETRLSR